MADPSLTDFDAYCRWLIDWRDETASLLFVWINPDGSEQPVLMPGWLYHWWAERASLEN